MSSFSRSHVEKLLYNKFVVIIGDSVQRAVYKDLVCLLTSGDLLQNRHLKSKGESTVFGDSLIERSDLTNGKWYREVRQYHQPSYLIRFYFVTRCYGDYMETILLDLAKEPSVDVVVMNSCLWDVSRYGHRGISQYQENLQILFSRFKTVLPPLCLLIWHTAMPVGNKIKTRGFLLPDIAFLENILSLQVREGNYYACQVAEEYQADIIDLHWFFKHHLDMQVQDGIHWNAEAHRRITNILLTHLCAAWDISLPPPSLVLSGSAPRAVTDSRPRSHRRGHQRCSSLPDIAFTGLHSRGSQHDSNNNSRGLQQDLSNNRGHGSNNSSRGQQYEPNSRGQTQHDPNNNWMSGQAGARVVKNYIEPLGQDAMARMSQGVNAYNMNYGFVPGTSFFQQGQYVGAMRQNHMTSLMRVSTTDRKRSGYS